MANECEGRPTEPCPYKKNDNTVKWSICDRWLCPDCLEYREPMKVCNNNGNSNKEPTKICNNNGNSNKVKCELLCFMMDKVKILPLDQVVLICADFYEENEVMAARNLLDEHTPYRLPKRKGQERIKCTIEDLAKACLDPNMKLPEYYATNMSRLPPVDLKHCDVSAILLELQALRQEVRAFGELQLEMSAMKQQLAEVMNLKEQMADYKKIFDDLNINEFSCPGKDISMVDIINSQEIMTQKAETLADIVKKNVKAPVNEGNSRPTNETGKAHSNKPAARRMQIYGKAHTDRNITVDNIRRVELFVSRLQPDTTTEEMSEMATNSFSNLTAVAVEELKTRFDTYTSFHVTLSIKHSGFQDLLAAVYSENNWPEGVFVRRYFSTTKNGATKKQ